MKAEWALKTFDDVLEIRNGKNQREVESESGEFPIFGSAGNVMGYATSYICEAGTTIIGRKGNINTPIFATTKFWNVDTAFGLAAKPCLNDKFLFYYCLSYDFSLLNRGTTIPSLVKSELLHIQIPLPPLPEQHRIVTLLDQAFDQIATAKANAEANLRNARALFESHLQGVFERRGDGWEIKSLKELTTTLGDGLHGTPIYSEDGDYHFINGNNLMDGKIEFKLSTKKVSIDEFIKYKKNLTDRTILVSINGTLGNVAFYNGEKVILGKSACYFNLKSGIEKNYIKHLLLSPYFFDYAHREATGATIKNVSLKTMREFDIPLPPLIEQQKIVFELDSLNVKIQRLEALYQQKLTALEALKKSLLHQAFSGLL